MKLSEVKSGTFFEFIQPGYCFGRCLWLGIDDFNQLSFVHLSAAQSRFIHNDELQDRDPEVTINVPQSWRKNFPEGDEGCYAAAQRLVLGQYQITTYGKDAEMATKDRYDVAVAYIELIDNIRKAIDYAGGRETEWGERAEKSFEMLEKSLKLA